MQIQRFQGPGFIRLFDGLCIVLALSAISGCGFVFPPGPQAAPLGPGLPGAGAVFSLCVDGEDLYAVGSTVPSGVANWHGTTWSPLNSSGTSLSKPPRCILVYGIDLIVGGDFIVLDAAGAEIAKNIAKWNGAAWEALSGGSTDGDVLALTIYNNDLIVGGSFTKAGTTAVSNISRWNGAWAPIGAGLDGPVYTLATYQGSLIAAGNLPTYSYVASWNGTPWSRLGGPGTNGPSGPVYSLAVLNNELFVGGLFDKVQGQDAANVGKWTGSGWVPTGRINGLLNSLAVHGGALYAGGGFTTTESGAASHLARWDGATWQAVGSGLTAGSPIVTVTALAEYKDKLITAGRFTAANGQPAANVAEWSP